jgi:CubicO group peptidase (beta-lactamase class C family)
VGELKVEIAPEDAGFDARRLERLDRHFARYVDDGRLPGWLILAETTFEGVGFGLGFSVVEDNVANRVLSTIGEFGWAGAASTASSVDPAEEITTLFFTQLLPSSTHPIRSQLKQLVYQALVD